MADAEKALVPSAENSDERKPGGGPPELPTPVQPRSEGEQRKPRVLLWAVVALALGVLAGATAGYLVRGPEVSDLADQLAALQTQQAELEADTEVARDNEQAMAEQVTACEDAIATGYWIMDNRMMLSDMMWELAADPNALTDDEAGQTFLDLEIEMEGLIATYEDDAYACLEGPSA